VIGASDHLKFKRNVNPRSIARKRLNLPFRQTAPRHTGPHHTKPSLPCPYVIFSALTQDENHEKVSSDVLSAKIKNWGRFSGDVFSGGVFSRDVFLWGRFYRIRFSRDVFSGTFLPRDVFSYIPFLIYGRSTTPCGNALVWRLQYVNVCSFGETSRHSRASST
jgi:hypothetical protein